MAKGDIKLSPKYGLNPAIPICFYCVKPKNEIILAGRLPRDEQAPQGKIWDMDPCSECAELMKKGVILISVKDDERDHECLICKHSWSSPVQLSPHTANLSGEATVECPRCSSHACSSSPVKTQDKKNPYRTGGWVVVKDEAIKNVFEPEELANATLEARFAFVTDNAWIQMGLPRGKE